MRKSLWGAVRLISAIGLVYLLVLLTAICAAGCDPGVGVTYINNTDGVLLLEISPGGEERMEPHSKASLASLGLDDEPYVVTIRDESGNVLYHEETTIGKIKERDQPILIEEPTPSPTPP